MIHVIATVEVAEGRRGDFLKEFKNVVPAVRKEAGCIEYGPAVDLPTGMPQVRFRENTVVILEKWEGLDELKAHLKAPHMAEYRKRVKELVIGMDVQVLEPA
ncbi:MAG: putative quinol monooxygenase [Syntrophales bacterium]|nr:putative quinol monooxygenase [Syntrophales bacterium]MDD5232055.1 putative quinol monooxygenase [Syntrophales bacterium]MDD5532516.1 putative quinol monooxygenase [Syntrophales bacterium]